jgi:hypothetical protein
MATADRSTVLCFLDVWANGLELQYVQAHFNCKQRYVRLTEQTDVYKIFCSAETIYPTASSLTNGENLQDSF